MIRTFIEVPLFTKRWREIGLNDDDLLHLQIMLLKDPESGPVIEGTGGIRKVRFPLENRGKSGSARICYTDFAEYEVTYLITAFTKKDQENLTDEEKSVLRKLVKSLREAERDRKEIVMSTLFEDLQEGLLQAIDYAKGQGPARVVTYKIDPITEFDKEQIRQIRMNAQMTQHVLADYLGVSVKTVEAWERGRTHPTGPACRLLSLLSNNQTQVLPFISVE